MSQRSWLIVGHGSVGSSLAQRIDARGERLLIYDPSPRVPISIGRRLERLEGHDGPVDYVISCVPPAAARQVPDLIAPMVREDAVLLEWNTVSPEVKQAIASACPCEMLDVALLDSLDANGAQPRVAISGKHAEVRRSLLESLGFHVDIAGPTPGDAALLKYARSIFMKSLEGLALEYFALAAPIDQNFIAANSLKNNLGEQSMEFLHLLVSTNRLHAARRAAELADAVQVLEARGASLQVARAVVPLLERAAQVWKESDAPAANATLDELVAYLETRL